MAGKDDNSKSDLLLTQATKLDEGKVRMELLPMDALYSVAEVMTFGAKKYGDHNWTKGFRLSRLYGALLRHLAAWWTGEDNDRESGCSHMAHAACCVIMLMWYVKHPTKGIDDRYRIDGGALLPEPERVVPRYDDKGVVEPPCS